MMAIYFSLWQINIEGKSLFPYVCVGLSSKAIVLNSLGHHSGQRDPGSRGVCMWFGSVLRWFSPAGVWLLEWQACVRLGVNNSNQAPGRRKVSFSSVNRLYNGRINSTHIFLLAKTGKQVKSQNLCLISTSSSLFSPHRSQLEDIWTIKKAERRRIDTFELWCWRRLLRVLCTARRSNQSILKEVSPYIHWKDRCWSSSTWVTWCEEPTFWKRPWCWEILRAGGEEGGRGWKVRMASPTQWAWVWANSWRWWRTGKPGILQSMGLQRVGHDWAAEQQDDTTFIDKSLSGSRAWGHLYDLAPVTSYFLPSTLCTTVLQAHCFPP